MKKFKHLMLTLVVGLGSALLFGCGSGVDQANPQAVAAKALEYYNAGDYTQLKTLVDPADAKTLEQVDKLIEMAEEFVKKHPDSKPEPVESTFKSISDGLRGGDFTDATTTARVHFDSEKWPRTVVVVKVDGKWYFEQFR